MTTRSIVPLLVLVAGSAASAADLERGVEILRQRECTVCHSILGVGGSGAPDLGVRRVTDWDDRSLAATLWNHGPRMWRQMQAAGMETPELPKEEVAALYEFLSSLWRYDPIGTASFGRDVWMDHQCYRCHPIVGSEQGIGTPVSSWPALPDAVEWVRQMWNHAGPMGEEIDDRGGVWPTFTPQEFVDLMAYVDNLSQLDPPDPEIGEETVTGGERHFREGACSNCHTIGAAEGGKVDLSTAGRDLTMTELAVEMWNHGPVMSTSPDIDEIELPELDRDQVVGLLAYISSESRNRVGGDVELGRQAFDAKKCSVCHSPMGEAPPLDMHEEPYSLIDLATSVWRHGPDMVGEMQSQGTRWPTLTEEDVANLLAYLNR